MVAVAKPGDYPITDRLLEVFRAWVTRRRAITTDTSAAGRGIGVCEVTTARRDRYRGLF